MNANELADALEDKSIRYSESVQDWLDDAKNMLRQQAELQTLVKSFFEDYLNYQEESDSGRVFNPIHISCTRVAMIEPLAELLMRMKELSGVEK
jgi:hypothetical protein